jgi:hypothetical protein
MKMTIDGERYNDDNPCNRCIRIWYVFLCGYRQLETQLSIVFPMKTKQKRSLYNCDMCPNIDCK